MAGDRRQRHADRARLSLRYRRELDERRRDFLVIPGAAVVFPNLFAYRRDLRIEYKFQHDHSNDPTQSFNDHIVAATVAARF